MTLTPNYNPNPLHPIIIITDQEGGPAYTFESKQLNPTPTQDFNLEALRMHVGVDDDFGYLQLLIHDHNNIFTDTTKDRRPGKIGREWGIQLYLGKTLATKERWFYGKVKDFTVSRPETGLQMITLNCVGWGVILRDRMTRLVRNQAKTSDGVTLDDTDDSTKISALIEDLFTDTDHYVDENITKISNINVSVTSGSTGAPDEGIDGDATSGKVANVNFNVSSFAQALSSLTGIANTQWYINADRDLIVADPETHNSGFLFTNDLSGDTAQNWDSTKIAYLLNSSIEWQDSSSDMLYNFVHGFGHFNPAIGVSYETAPDASDNLDTAWHAIPITPPTDNIQKVAVRMVKSGTPPTGLSVEIWGDSGGSGPDPTDIRHKVTVPQSRLLTLGTSVPATFFEIPITPRLDITPGEQLYIVFRRFGTASNTVDVNYKSGTGTFWDSSDGITWTSRTGATAYRVWDSKRYVTTVENIDATTVLPEPRERIFAIRADLEAQTVRETLIQAATVLGKEKRTYGKITISPPDSRIPLLSFCTLQDQKTGLSVTPNIVGYELEASSESQGVQRITLDLEAYRR